MTLLFTSLATAAAFLLVPLTFVQMLYMESLRLRARDLPSMRYFRDVLEPRFGIKAEQGALTFSLLKHACLIAFAVLSIPSITSGAPTWPVLLEAAGIAILTLIAGTYAVPQVLYRRTEGAWLLPLWPLLHLLTLAIRPLVVLLNFLQSLVELADENGGEQEEATPEENIEALISAGEEEGLIEEDDRKLIQSVVAFGDKVVREVMTPRPNMVTISAAAHIDDLRQLVISEQFSRIPVFENSIDQIIGFVHVRDMFELDEDDRDRYTVRDLMRPVKSVPETKPVHDLTREMQADGGHIAIVVDEYGNTAGLVTMEDLVEVILGEIRDEHEPTSDVIADSRGGYIVSGSFDLARLQEMLDFRPHEEIESTSVGGLVTEWLGHVPEPGETVEREGIRVEVLASDRNRVAQVRLSRSQQPVSNE